MSQSPPLFEVQYPAYFFDLGGTFLALEDDEIAFDSAGRVSLLPGVVERLRELAGRSVFVITNQSGVALGTLTAEQACGFVDRVNEHVGNIIQDYRICMHHPAVGCGCRKPRPGMVLDLAATHGVDLSRASWSATPRMMRSVRSMPALERLCGRTSSSDEPDAHGPNAARKHRLSGALPRQSMVLRQRSSRRR